MEYSAEDVRKMLGESCYKMYERLESFISDNYIVNQVWAKGGKYGNACLRYSKSGKTLCTVYLREKQLGVWIILGREERSRFEAQNEMFSAEVREKYDCTQTFHDGKWLMFDVKDDSLFDEIKMLLEIKKKPNKKPAEKGI
ncbi:MAG: DUF3788 family protein [Ruminiclostridium sp.]